MHATSTPAVTGARPEPAVGLADLGGETIDQMAALDGMAQVEDIRGRPDRPRRAVDRCAAVA